MKQRIETKNGIISALTELIGTGALIKGAGAFAAGLVMSRAAMFGTVAPFGISLAAGLPMNLMLPALIGAAVGYSLPLMPVAGATKYLAALCIVAVIRFLLHGKAKFAAKGAFAAVLALVATAIPSLISAYVQLGDVILITIAVSEAFLAAAVAFFVFVAGKSVERGFVSSILDRKQHACIVAVLSVMLLALCGVNIVGFSLGRCLAVLAILIIASGYGPSMASATGVIVGITVGFGNFSLMTLAGVYGFAGLLSGVFSTFGRIGCATAFIIANGLSILMAGTGVVPMMVLYEVMGATFLFMVIPQSLLNQAAAFRLESKNSSKSVGRELHTRLTLASNAMREVRAAVETVSEGLMKINTEDISSVYDTVADNVCGHCEMRLSCWGTHYNRTMGAFNSLSETFKQKTRVTEDDYPPQFLESCTKVRQITVAVNEAFEKFRAKETSTLRFTEIRAIVSEQFEAMSELLDELGNEALSRREYKQTLSVLVREYLEGTGIYPKEVICESNMDKRISLSIQIATDEIESISRVRLAKVLSGVCKRTLSMPVISEKDGLTTIVLKEKPKLAVQYGEYQSAYKESKLCGDNIRYLQDTNGRAQLVLSDGMGSGPAAAVDSAMTSSLLTKMISAGLKPSGALKFANSALLIKSAEESLSTADITIIDLYSGKAEIFKAGAAPTFIKSRGKTFVLEGDSLPIGILNGVSIDQNSFELEKGDIVLMVSDGAVVDGPEWIISELEQYEKEDMGALTKKIVETAKSRRADGHDDDISAAAVLLTAAAT